MSGFYPAGKPGDLSSFKGRGGSLKKEEAMKARYNSPCAGCRKMILQGAEMRYLGKGQSYHVGCVPTRQKGKKAPKLPTSRTSGRRGHVRVTMADWKRIRDDYRKAGIDAEIVVPSFIGRNGRRVRWKQYALEIGGRVRVSTTIHTTGDTRKKGANAIDIVAFKGDKLIGGRTKVLRTEGWQGRVKERVNSLLRETEEWSAALAS